MFMKITIPGKDYIIINNIDDLKVTNDKVHLIKFNFQIPDATMIDRVLLAYPKTNRFIISNYIKIYNDILKFTGKKFYVENSVGVDLISFFRKNNKILLNFNNLREHESSFLLHQNILLDVLRNVEVINIPKSLLDKYITLFNEWDGNIILT